MREEVMQQPTSTRGARGKEREGGATREGVNNGVARRRTTRMTMTGDSITASATATTTKTTATTATMATMATTAASSRGATWDMLLGKWAKAGPSSSVAKRTRGLTTARAMGGGGGATSKHCNAIGDGGGSRHRHRRRVACCRCTRHRIRP